MRSKEWQRKAWLLAVVVVLLFVVNPELRALVFLVDALSLEVFLLFVGLQVKEMLLLMRPAVVKMLASLARPSAAGARHLGGAARALLPRFLWYLSRSKCSGQLDFSLVLECVAPAAVKLYECVRK